MEVNHTDPSSPAVKASLGKVSKSQYDKNLLVFSLVVCFLWL
jgi:hypothetical protein